MNSGAILARRVVVGVADLKAGIGVGSLITHALGSCIAVIGWDPTYRIGVMLHLRLPSSREDGERVED